MSCINFLYSTLPKAWAMPLAIAYALRYAFAVAFVNVWDTSLDKVYDVF